MIKIYALYLLQRLPIVNKKNGSHVYWWSEFLGISDRGLWPLIFYLLQANLVISLSYINKGLRRSKFLHLEVPKNSDWHYTHVIPGLNIKNCKFTVQTRRELKLYILFFFIHLKVLYGCPLQSSRKEIFPKIQYFSSLKA